MKGGSDHFRTLRALERLALQSDSLDEFADVGALDIGNRPASPSRHQVLLGGPLPLPDAAVHAAGHLEVPADDLFEGQDAATVLSFLRRVATAHDNDAGAPVNWMFGVEQAWLRLGHTYPTPTQGTGDAAA